MKLEFVQMTVLVSVLAAPLLVLPAGADSPQGSDAKSIVKAMSDYVGSLKTIQLTFDSDIEVITPTKALALMNYSQ